MASFVAPGIAVRGTSTTPAPKSIWFRSTIFNLSLVSSLISTPGFAASVCAPLSGQESKRDQKGTSEAHPYDRRIRVDPGANADNLCIYDRDGPVRRTSRWHDSGRKFGSNVACLKAISNLLRPD